MTATDATAEHRATQADPTDWFNTTAHQLRAGVEAVYGLDDKPLLFIPSTGKYLAIGRGLQQLLPLLDGQRTGAQLLMAAGAQPSEVLTGRLADAFHELRQSGALVQEPVAEPVRRSLARFMRREHLLRLPLTRSIDSWLEPMVAPLRRIPGRWLAGIWFALAGVGMVLGGYALATAGANWQLPAQLWWIYLVLFAQIACHELSHALVCQYLRVPVREAGIGLMLYLMPVGYVDRTDSYRVRSRPARAFLSLAGPVNDQIWFGITALIALQASGELAHLAFAMLGVQLLLTLMNFNPLVPSDGYHALCAMTGAVNYRGKALSYLTHRLLRLPLGEAQAASSAGQARGYLCYALGCLIFVGLLLAGLMRTIRTVLEVIS